MDVIEFFNKTDHRNLKQNLDYMVQAKLREIRADLERRKEKLRFILEFENQQYNEELSMLAREQTARKQSERFTWKRLREMEYEREEEKLLEISNKQREFENSELARLEESKRILVETKMVQLYQIEEKKAMRRKEQRIDNWWLEASKKMNDEKLKEETQEVILQKTIASRNQGTNSRQDKDQRCKNELEMAALREEMAEENLRAAAIEKFYKEREERLEKAKKVHQGRELEQQIEDHQKVQALKKHQEQVIDKQMAEIEYQQILNELGQKKVEKLHEHEWSNFYLAHAREEKEDLQKRENQLEEMHAGRGCILQQEDKTPYGKASR